MDEKTRKKFSQVIGMEIPRGVDLKVTWEKAVQSDLSKELERVDGSTFISMFAAQVRREMSRMITGWDWVDVDSLHFVGLHQVGGVAIAAKGSAVIWKVAEGVSGPGDECLKVDSWHLTVNGTGVDLRAIFDDDDNPRAWADECLVKMLKGDQDG